ncbi:MocR-like pyridoxine biosynthesis transcription factor PdxR [Frigidibacter sp. MR17.24]|uniref:MocR-like pyridoxine biosynthesis transcription factor PdxR n=1 Tax=Frigidibacter sp. MR17.24 TaxID=3127345 RepID=UPI0030130F13
MTAFNLMTGARHPGSPAILFDRGNAADQARSHHHRLYCMAQGDGTMEPGNPQMTSGSSDFRINSAMPHNALIWQQYFRQGRSAGLTLQLQVRQLIVQLVVERKLLRGARVPSTRQLAETLDVSRNTIAHAYDLLVQDGYLCISTRQGHFVNPELVLETTVGFRGEPGSTTLSRLPQGRVSVTKPDSRTAISRQSDWRAAPFPFVHGQIDRSLSQGPEWREAMLLTCNAENSAAWVSDYGVEDDPAFVEQLRRYVLPRRGIGARREEILVTLGAQNALFLIAYALCAQGTTLGTERFVYPDVRNIFRARGARLIDLDVDEQGLDPHQLGDEADIIYVAPSHQNPTTVTMPLDRRIEVLEAAAERNVILIEDDYDSELTFSGSPNPAIKALDTDNRVIYIGSLSKTLASGLRLGYIVAPADFIDAARSARQLMMRHPPANNQRAAAHYIGLGHHERYMTRLAKAFAERVRVTSKALGQYLPEARFVPPNGGSSIWLSAPDGTNMAEVEHRAAAQGVLFDAGNRFLADTTSSTAYFRLGLSAIDTAKIEPGIRLLADIIRSA